MKSSIILRTMLVMLAASVSFAAHAQDSVQELADKWTAAYNTHDRNALGALYAEDARLMMHGAPTYAGREEIEEFWANDFEIENPLTLLTVTHSVDGVDMILVHGNYQVIDRDTGAQLGGGRFAHIWMLDDDGEWQLDRDLWHEPFEPYE